jgi:hypothetical protein
MQELFGKNKKFGEDRTGRRIINGTLRGRKKEMGNKS